MEQLDRPDGADLRDSSQVPSIADALAAACQVAAGLFRTPGEGLAADLRSGRLLQVTDALALRTGVDAPPALRRTVAFRALEVAYVALFVSRMGGVPAPPYVGLAYDGELMGPTVRRLASEFEALGLRTKPTWRELPDHVAAVAEAIELLLENGRFGAAVRIAEEYLMPWLERYGAAIADADETGFYGATTLFLHAVLKELLT